MSGAAALPLHKQAEEAHLANAAAVSRKQPAPRQKQAVYRAAAAARGMLLSCRWCRRHRCAARPPLLPAASAAAAGL
jgi:hypothetical protein